MNLKSSCYRIVGKLWSPRLHLPCTDRGDAIAILCLHGVHDEAMEKAAPPPTSSISTVALKTNLRALARFHTVVPLGEAMAMLDGRVPWRPRCAVLTFDDSLACTLNIAVPVLLDMGMTATVFVSTQIVDDRVPYWWLRADYAWHHGRPGPVDLSLPDGTQITVEKGNLDSHRKLKAILRQTPAGPRDYVVSRMEEGFNAQLADPASQYPYATPMTWDDVRKLNQLGFDVGSHTVSHPNLTLLPTDEVRRELAESKAIIEQKTGTACPHFCYPYGRTSDEIQTLAKAAGYMAATSTVSPGANRPGGNHFALRRYQMPGLPWKLGWILSGLAASRKSS
jgi:peptidoglycan/xylan/chitin deacetylase (PgdA/CDA1 family)